MRILSILVSLLLIVSFLYVDAVWAASDLLCPAKAKKSLTAEEIGAKIKECLDARNAVPSRESSITEFYCPSGDFTITDGRPLNNDTIPYHVAVALIFAEIDQTALAYMCDLREMREKDPVKWTEDIRKKFELTTASDVNTLAESYLWVCNFWYIEMRIGNNTKDEAWIKSTNTYPQSICKSIAKRKVQAWYNMAYILMWDGIAKSYQNDKDTFIGKVKSKYSVIIDKYNQYVLLAGNTIKNLTWLPENSIRR